MIVCQVYSEIARIANRSMRRPENDISPVYERGEEQYLKACDFALINPER
jgi:hypothetical protein